MARFRWLTDMDSPPLPKGWTLSAADLNRSGAAYTEAKVAHQTL